MNQSNSKLPESEQKALGAIFGDEDSDEDTGGQEESSKPSVSGQNVKKLDEGTQQALAGMFDFEEEEKAKPAPKPAEPPEPPEPSVVEEEPEPEPEVDPPSPSDVSNYVDELIAGGNVKDIVSKVAATIGEKNVSDPDG